MFEAAVQPPLVNRQYVGDQVLDMLEGGSADGASESIMPCHAASGSLTVVSVNTVLNTAPS